MQAQPNAAPARRPGFFARLVESLRSRIRRILGKDEPPNIYPFF